MSDSLTRREFLKEMGLLGLGAGIAPSLLGPIEVFGEQWSDTAADDYVDHPNWVKKVDKPTMEIDWDVMERYAETNTCRAGTVKYAGEEAMAEWAATGKANVEKWLKEGRPGFSLRDWALSDAIRRAAFGGAAPPKSFVGAQDVPTPEDRGVPRWEGTPEDNALMVRSALRHFGAATVGFVELDTNTTEKLIYSHDPDGKEMRIEDADAPEEGEDYRLIPRKARYAIVWTVQMSQETLTRAPTALGALTTTLTYERNNHIQNRLQAFLHGLGYMGLAESSINALAIAPALGVMAGLGEMSRINRLITPEYGPMVRVFKMLTDLPLPNGSPIDFGVMEFCKYCKTCAEYCPSGSLSMDTEPSWETVGGWNNPGHKAYFENSLSCRQYWAEVGTNCGTCFSVCPFAQKDKAAVHKLVQATIAATPLFDSTFVKASRAAYLTQPMTEPQKDPDEWWTLDLTEYGIDSTRGHADA